MIPTIEFYHVLDLRLVENDYLLHLAAKLTLSYLLNSSTSPFLTRQLSQDLAKARRRSSRQLKGILRVHESRECGLVSYNNQTMIQNIKQSTFFATYNMFYSFAISCSWCRFALSRLA